MKKFLYASLCALGVVFFWQQPAHAGTLFFDDMESGSTGWTATGLWHVQTDPQDISVSGDINPDLVSLPDFGYLPNAYSGSSAWWYGSADDGTFMGDWSIDSQTSKNGGWSDDSNSGELISPEIDLTAAEDATLSFWHWWEVEGVDVDRYDLMTVYASTDAGTTWTTVATMNPANDVDGESWKPYSSGGLGQVGQWLYTNIDLSDYAGNTVQLKFSFDTVDEKYNGFRGWLLDDVLVTDDATVKPAFDTQTQQASVQCSGTDNESVTQTPAQFYVQRAQKVEVTSAGDWVITPLGSDDIVVSGEAGITSNVYLNAGFYTLWVNFTADQTCPDATLTLASVSFRAGPGQPSGQAGNVITFYGNDFVAGSSTAFIGSKTQTALGTSVHSAAKTDADTVVLSSTELQVTIPDTLSDGTYALQITSPSGKKGTLSKAISVTSETAPDIDSISPEEIDDSTTTDITISGSGFVDGAVVTVGGMPINHMTVSDTEITGTVPAGAPAGFQNIVVVNPDGQVAKLVGGVSVDDNETTGYTPAGTELSAPDKVKNILASAVRAHGATITWDAVTDAENYVITIKSKGKVVRSVQTTDTHKKIFNLKSGKKFHVQVRAYSTYAGGKLSIGTTFTTL